MRNAGIRRASVALLFVFAACDAASEAPVIDEDRAHTISLSSQVIDTRTAAPDAVTRAAGTSEYMLVKYGAPITAAQFDALAEQAIVYTYLPHDTFLVKARPGIAALTPPGATWTGRYKPDYKISTMTRDLAAAAPAEGRAVMITVYPDADLDRVVAAAKALPGASILGFDHGDRFSRVRVWLAGAQLTSATQAIAQIADVFWVDVEGRRVLLNDTTIWVGQSGLGVDHTTPIFNHGIHGEGQIVGYVDTGVDIDSCYFRDDAHGVPPINTCNTNSTLTDTAQRKVIGVDFMWQNECAGGITSSEWDTHGHGSHVGGTIAGDNFANPIAHDPGDGMAPGAKLVVQDCGFQTDNCADCPGIGCPVVDLKPIFLQAYTQGARIHTNSWGDQENASPQNNYTAACQDVDQFTWDHKDFLLLFAAGNSGPGQASVGSPSTAKNTISVGATLRGASANSMASFSSCGPAADGRIKPDLTIPGSGIISARSDFSTTTNNCNTQSMSGTSMASPAAAGFAALARQYYTDGFYPSGVATTADRFQPQAATVKATLLNSTQSMTSAGVIPDNCQGWGRILLDNTLYFANDTDRKMFVTEDAGFPTGGAGQTRTFTVNLAANSPLRATLVWTDFPSTPAANPNLVNDLDLEVSGPGGTFKGNVFTQGNSTPGGSADRRNTVEQVQLATAPAGTYTVTVRGFNIPSGPQPFSLVVSGAIVPSGGNHPPVANAGADQSTTVNTAVTLNGSGSSDPDGNPLTYAWTQTGGPGVTLSTPNAVSAGFTPTVAGSYTFNLHVSDGTAAADDAVTVTVTGPVNHPPVSNAGPDQDAAVNTQVTLTGAASSDPDGNPLTYAWTQTQGPTVTLSTPNAVTARFTPTVAGAYTFSLRVSDGTATADDTVTVMVSGPINRPPVSNAGPDQASTVNTQVTLTGAASSDPDGNPLTYAWTQTQGPTVTLSTPNAVTARFTPTVAGSYTFNLRVSDGTATADDTVTVTVTSGGPTIVWSDDFETSKGWTANPAGTDTAGTGRWERGDPASSNSMGPKQLGTTVSGSFDLVTGARVGLLGAGDGDIDGGTTTIRSPAFAIPAGGTVALSFSYYFAHGTNATSADYLRVSIVGTTTTRVLEELGNSSNDDAVWAVKTVDISAFAGQNVRILVEAADAGSASLVEAAVDDVVIRRQ